MIRAIVEELMGSLHGYGAGVVRAALKRGHSDRTNLRPLQDYRQALADQAVALLVKRAKLKQTEHVIRVAVQMAEATALDVLLHDRGPLRLGTQRMATTLSAMMLRFLALTGADRRNDDASSPTDDRDQDRMLDMPIEEVVAMPVTETPSTHRRQPHRQPTQPAKRLPIATPASIAAGGGRGDRRAATPWAISAAVLGPSGRSSSIVDLIKEHAVRAYQRNSHPILRIESANAADLSPDV